MIDSSFSQDMGKLKDLDVAAPQVDALVHGFAGYFHCELYAGSDSAAGHQLMEGSTVPGLSVSINPESYSEGMFSWQGDSDDMYGDSCCSRIKHGFPNPELTGGLELGISTVNG